MRVSVYVEGESDKLALEALWQDWRDRLRRQGHGIDIHPLSGKAKFLRKIGAHAAQKLRALEENIVVGLPDLYPNREYRGTDYEHEDLSELQRVQTDQVRDALANIYGLTGKDLQAALGRFYPSALKHDLEMLLLAAKDELRSYLGTPDKLGAWRKPVEDQDQDHPPKRVVEELFITKSRRKRAYRDTVHARAIMAKVADIKQIIYDEHGQVQCPAFKAMLDSIGVRLGVTAYS